MADLTPERIAELRRLHAEAIGNLTHERRFVAIDRLVAAVFDSLPALLDEVERLRTFANLFRGVATVLAKAVGAEECPPIETVNPYDLADACNQRVERLRCEVERLRAEVEYVSGYQSDLAVIRKALDQVDAPHDPEDGVSLEPRRIHLLAQQRDAARAEVDRMKRLVDETRISVGHSLEIIKAISKERDDARDEAERLRSEVERLKSHTRPDRVVQHDHGAVGKVTYSNCIGCIADERDAAQAELEGRREIDRDFQETARRLGVTCAGCPGCGTFDCSPSALLIELQKQVAAERDRLRRIEQRLTAIAKWGDDPSQYAEALTVRFGVALHAIRDAFAIAQEGQK